MNPDPAVMVRTCITVMARGMKATAGAEREVDRDDAGGSRCPIRDIKDRITEANVDTTIIAGLRTLAICRRHRTIVRLTMVLLVTTVRLIMVHIIMVHLIMVRLTMVHLMRLMTDRLITVRLTMIHLITVYLATVRMATVRPITARTITVHLTMIRLVRVRLTPVRLITVRLITVHIPMVRHTMVVLTMVRRTTVLLTTVRLILTVVTTVRTRHTLADVTAPDFHTPPQVAIETASRPVAAPEMGLALTVVATCTHTARAGWVIFMTSASTSTDSKPLRCARRRSYASRPRRRLPAWATS